MSAFVARYDALVNELRTKVKVLPHGAPEQKAIELTCLWDTGAQFSVITPRVADILGLDAVDLKKAYTANGIYETPVYRLDAILPTGHRVWPWRFAPHQQGHDRIRLSHSVRRQIAIVIFTLLRA